jgi:hypothetical protein
MASRRKFDSPWKTILEALFPEFMQLFVPEAHADIDWTRQPKFLDKELAQTVRGAPSGPQAVDRLVEVALLDGSPTWVLVHIEVQSQRDTAFASRMFQYHTRILERFHRQPVSVAVLADSEPGWRPDGFGYARWGCSVRLDFPVVKLMDWANRPEALTESGNPFGIAAAAHLAALAAGKRPNSRYVRRKALYRDMRRMGISQEKASALMTFMDWVLELPEELDDRFWSEVNEEEGGSTMQYMSRFEMKAIERGRQEGVALGRQEGVALGRQEGEARGLRQGLLEAVQLGLELRFGKSALAQMDELRGIESVETLKRVKDALTTVAGPAELRSIYSA